jgi:peptide deformylase|tara:strand:- start:422 stop:943 length:522 start_codon:yes stop_codon:yes gene_type:complete
MYIELVKYPDVFLRSVSKDVPFPLDDKDSRLIKWMTKAMYQHQGIGIAAIQVGYQKKIFIMDCSRSRENPKVFINPVIITKSDEILRDVEGCLSAPGKQGDVKRHIRIILKYNKENGEEEQKTFYNLEARCIQHEMDHLEGKLCIDYEKGNYNSDKHKSQTMGESDFRTKSDE